MKRFSYLVTPLLLSGLVATGCVEDEGSTDEPAGVTEKDDTNDTGKGDAWNWRNDPSRLDQNFEYNIDKLELSGDATHKAWAGDYWATYNDSINHRWQGQDSLSPAEKYDVAFNGWDPSKVEGLVPFNSRDCDAEWDEEYYDNLGPVASYVSKNMGNARSRDGRDSDGDGEVDECGSRDNDGVETWFGLCHAWVPASMLEDEPLKAVEYNGVTFEVSDIKALIVAAYDKGNASLLGGRCNDKSDDLERDEFGRIVKDDCRDTNPGTLHVIMTNLLGREGRAFAFDRTFDFEVWNQPVTGYKISKQEEITEERALELLNRTDVEEYPYNDEAKRFVEVHASIDYVTESHASTQPTGNAGYIRTDRYQYILELDGDGNIIGGEYIKQEWGGRFTTGPDFLWFPTGIRYMHIPTMDLEKIRMLIRMSRDDQEPNDSLLSFSSDTVVDIKDNDDKNPATSAITVDESVAAADVTATVNITHTWIGDLKVVLEHNGTEVTLHNRQGGSRDWKDIETNVFEAEDFRGVDAKGDWTLKVTDHAGGDVGTIDSWELQIQPSSTN